MRFLRPLALVASLASLGAGSVLAADALGPAELAAYAIPRPRLSYTPKGQRPRPEFEAALKAIRAPLDRWETSNGRSYPAPTPDEAYARALEALKLARHPEEVGGVMVFLRSMHRVVPLLAVGFHLADELERLAAEAGGPQDTGYDGWRMVITHVSGADRVRRDARSVQSSQESKYYADPEALRLDLVAIEEDLILRLARSRLVPGDVKSVSGLLNGHQASDDPPDRRPFEADSPPSWTRAECSRIAQELKDWAAGTGPRPNLAGGAAPSRLASSPPSASPPALAPPAPAGGPAPSPPPPTGEADIEAWLVYRPGRNLAAASEGARVVASTSQYDTHEWAAARLLDADLATSWCSVENPTLPQDVVLALAGDGAGRVGRVVVHLGANGETGNHPTAFQVEAAEHVGGPWLDLGALHGLPEGKGIHALEVPPTLARFLRVRFLATNGQYIHVDEIEVIEQ